MFRRALFSLLAAGSFFTAQANDADVETSALYVHPVFTALFATTTVPRIFIPITYENEFSGNNSFTIQPTFQYLKITTRANDNTIDSRTIAKEISGMVSYRKYFLSEKAQGLYVAPAAKVNYDEAKANWIYSNTSTTATGFGIAALAYIGCRTKAKYFTAYVDFGAGPSYFAVSGDKNVKGISKSGITYDGNVGFGIPF